MDFDTRLAAYVAVIDDAGRILLTRWLGPRGPEWTVPGGGVDLHETCEQGAVREAEEETGYRVELDGLLGVDTIVIEPADRIRTHDRWLKGVRVIYAAHIVGGELRDELDGSTDKAAWFTRDEIASLPRVGLVDVLVSLLDRAPADGHM